MLKYTLIISNRGKSNIEQIEKSTFHSIENCIKKQATPTFQPSRIICILFLHEYKYIKR